MGLIIGADEVGLGSWAGPICVAAVMAPEEWHLKGIGDSKKVTKRNRITLSKLLWEQHQAGKIFISVEMRPNTLIDREGISTVQKALFVQTINACSASRKVESCRAIVDGTLILNKVALSVPYSSLIGADGKISTCMAASIVAKVHRDTYMQLQHSTYPEYDFLHNVGYRSLKHEAALKKLGPTPLHRMSYKVKCYG